MHMPSLRSLAESVTRRPVPGATDDHGRTAVPATHDNMHGEKVNFGTIIQLALEEVGPGAYGRAFGEGVREYASGRIEH
jgi:hypothetical protein